MQQTAGVLTRCPRAFCGGVLVSSWGEEPTCLLCGRTLEGRQAPLPKSHPQLRVHVGKKLALRL